LSDPVAAPITSLFISRPISLSTVRSTNKKTGTQTVPVTTKVDRTSAQPSHSRRVRLPTKRPPAFRLREPLVRGRAAENRFCDGT